MKKVHCIVIFCLTFAVSSCDDTIKDEELPAIDMTGQAAFPQNCVTIYRGESFTFNALFSDNMELGSYSIEMHHNFDHHTHSTSSEECEMEAVKMPINPFRYIDEFTIPAAKTKYSATIEINIPSDVDTGDYHFMVRLTDKSGWQTFRGISLKVAEK